MKRDFHFHFYSKVFLAVVVSAIALFIWQKSIKTDAVVTGEMFIDGWAYNDKTGWLSLSCNNDINGDGIIDDNEYTCDSKIYGLTLGEIGGVNRVEGCMWSGQSVANNANNNLGWICLSNPPGSNAPVGGMDINSLNGVYSIAWPGISKLESAALSAGRDDDLNMNLFGQIKFDDPNFPSAANPISGCFNCYGVETKECRMGHNSCTTDDQCITQGDNCITISTNYHCENCLEYKYYDGKCSISGLTCQRNGDCLGGETCQPISTCNFNRDQPCSVDGDCGGKRCSWHYTQSCVDDADCPDDDRGEVCVSPACESRPVGSIKMTKSTVDCSSCSIQDINNTCDMNAQGYNKNSCPTCSLGFYNPGVVIDRQYNRATSAKLCGWAHNDELGWFWFSPKISTTTKPYISVEGGSIYSKGSIYSRFAPPVNRYNASFLIESSGNITNFISSATLSGEYRGELKNRAEIDFYALSGTKYRNPLGAIDFTGLITKDSNNKNKYNSTVSTVVDASEISGFANYLGGFGALNGRVIYIPGGSLSLGQDGSTVHVRNESNELSSGTIVVGGDLLIRANFEYDNTLSSISNLKEIPSLVWIIKGDLSVDPDVTHLVGTFVVLGNGSASCSTDPAQDHCGQFITCEIGETNCGNQLTIEGSVLAKKFVLRRTYYDQANQLPAELFINDGRIHANPPPGLVDFGQALPRFIEN